MSPICKVRSTSSDITASSWSYTISSSLAIVGVVAIGTPFEERGAWPRAKQISPAGFRRLEFFGVNPLPSLSKKELVSAAATRVPAVLAAFLSAFLSFANAGCQHKCLLVMEASWAPVATPAAAATTAAARGGEGERARSPWSPCSRQRPEGGLTWSYPKAGTTEVVRPRPCGESSSGERCCTRDRRGRV